ncbi:hypothetical protein COCNU_08G000060 [Cocos nucifera]|uniref:Uncharacterized protein n=1 Tax=Cocos nucifera TaxID=13894 RepID=A0A8K0N5P0_COCNU|nr:hypothetical protein COCNU_08G000060 [Cocos nucifera]
MVGPFTYQVSISKNFVSEQEPRFADSSSASHNDHHDDGEGENWEFWNGPAGRSPSTGSWRHHLNQNNDGPLQTGATKIEGEDEHMQPS